MRPLPSGVTVVPVRTPTLPPATHTNAWVLGQRRVTVVDPASPWPEEQERLADALAQVEVERIVLTHHHLDHASGAEDLRRRTGAPIVAHTATAARVSFPVDELIGDGELVATDTATWQALHTPGHATGHLCLFDPDSRTLVAGDMVAGIGTIVLDPPEGVLEDYLVSLERLRDLAARLLLPAHGPPLPEPAIMLGWYIAHRHERTDQIRQALAQSGSARPIDLVPAVYGEEIPRDIWPVAARQVLCHLQWLQARGEVEQLDDTRFQPR